MTTGEPVAHTLQFGHPTSHSLFFDHQVSKEFFQCVILSQSIVTVVPPASALLTSIFIYRKGKDYIDPQAKQV